MLIQATTPATAPTPAMTNDAGQSTAEKPQNPLHQAAKQAVKDAVVIGKLEAALDAIKQQNAEESGGAKRPASADKPKSGDDEPSATSKLADIKTVGTKAATTIVEMQQTTAASYQADGMTMQTRSTRLMRMGPEGLMLQEVRESAGEILTDNGLKISFETTRARQAYVGSSAGFGQLHSSLA